MKKNLLSWKNLQADVRMMMELICLLSWHMIFWELEWTRQESLNTLKYSSLKMQAKICVGAGCGTLLYHLAINPEKQENLRREILAQESLKPGTFENMPYLTACVKESLRLTPSVCNVIVNIQYTKLQYILHFMLFQLESPARFQQKL